MIFGCVLYDTSLNPSIITAGFLKESPVIQSIVWSCVGNEAGWCSEETAVFKIFVAEVRRVSWAMHSLERRKINLRLASVPFSNLEFPCKVFPVP